MGTAPIAIIDTEQMSSLSGSGIAPREVRPYAAEMTCGAVVFVKDVDRVARFYQRLAGMSVQDEEPGLCVLTSAGFELVIHAIPPQYAEGIAIADPPEAREDSYLKLVLPCADLAVIRSVRSRKMVGTIRHPARMIRRSICLVIRF